MIRSAALLLLVTAVSASCSPPKVEVAIDSTTAPAPTPWPPEFAAFATTDTLTGPAAPIDYTLDPDVKRFQGQLEAARTAPADFAGHYQFVTWGCGTACISYALLDLRAGRTLNDRSFNFRCENVEYRKESRLVIARPDTSLEAMETCPWTAVRYFALDSTGLQELLAPGTIAVALHRDTIVSLPIKNGEVITLVGNRSDGENAISYQYVGHLARIPFHLVRTHYYESAEFFLFHDSTGRRTAMREAPVISPSGSGVVSARFGFTSENESRIDIFQVAGDSLISEFRFVPDEDTWGPQTVYWASDDTIRIVALARTGSGIHEFRALPAYLSREGGNWVLHGPAILSDSSSVR